MPVSSSEPNCPCPDHQRSQTLSRSTAPVAVGAALWALAAACFGTGAASIQQPDRADPGTTPLSGSSDAPSPTAAASWDRMAEVSSWPPVTPQPYISLGHPPGYFLATVRVSPDDRDAYVNLRSGTELGVGAVVAQFQQDPARAEPGPVFVMIKQSADAWQYLIVDTTGRIEHRGESPLCERCHAEAVTDRLFGLPAPSDARSDGAR